ncbi:DUF1275 family protein [Micromonospora sp. NPDC003197]
MSGGGGGGPAPGGSDASRWQDAESEFRQPVLALALATGVAGYVDAFSLLRYGVFVANQSGSLIHLGMGLAGHFPGWPAALASIVGFGLGGGLAHLLRRRVESHRRAPPGPQLVVVIGVVLLWAGLEQALAVRHGQFGLAQRVPLAAVGAIGMGMHAVLFVRTAGVKTTTTYQSGTVLNTGENFVNWLRHSDRRRSSNRRWLLGFVGTGCYAAGGGFGALVTPWPVWVFVGAVAGLVVLLGIVRPPRFGAMD